MHLIGYALFGLVAGALARLLHPGRDPMNWFWTMLLGIGGAEVGGFIARQLGYVNEGLVGWASAVGGAILLLVLYHLVTARTASASDGTTATNQDYKQAVFDDLAQGPR